MQRTKIKVFAVSVFVIAIIVIMMDVVIRNYPMNNEPDLQELNHQTSRRTLLATDVEWENTITARNNYVKGYVAGNWGNNLPVPGESFGYWYQKKWQTMTLNDNVLYYDAAKTLSCNMHIDEYGYLDDGISYIEVLQDWNNWQYKVGSIIIASAPNVEEIHYECSTFPALIVTSIIRKSWPDNNILQLYVREAEMPDYISEVDCDIQNGILIDSGIDGIGEARKIEDLYNYFTQDHTSTATDNTYTFSNITYEELEYICFNENDGEEIEIINGICNELNTIDYFGQQYGINSIQFGENTLGINDVDDDNTRRRLRIGDRIKKAIKKAVKFVKKNIIEPIKTIIDILRGDVNERLFDVGLSISADKTFGIGGSVSDSSSSGVGVGVDGSFKISAGVDFNAGISADLVAKYKIFTLRPSFDLFKLSIKAETHLNVYIDIDVSGSVSVDIEIANVEKRKIFFLGPIPVVIKPYASLTFGVEVKNDINIAMQFGYEPIFIEYGVEFTPQNGFQKISNKQLDFIPIRNFGGDMDENCIEFSIKPFIEIQIGVVFYEVFDVFIAPRLGLINSLQYPSTCDNDIEKCDHTPLQARFSMDFEFSAAIGLEVGLGSLGLPTTSTTFDLGIDIGTIPLFDTCFTTNIFPSVIDQICCG